MNQEIFERYLQYRFQRAGAVTAGQRLEVLQQIKEEARQGVVPLDDHSVATVDLKDPAVQAVLRGESVSLGGKTLRKKVPGFSLPKMPAGGQRKGLILLLVFLVPICLTGILFAIRNSSKIAAALALTPSATALPPTLATDVPTLAPTVTFTPTIIPTSTLLPDQVLFSSGQAAEDPTSPASIEIGGRRFVVLEGEVDKKSGVWEPSGVEWLKGTVIRKVFAIPSTMISDTNLSTGDPIRVRYRNGYTVTYALTQSEQVIVDQIELMRSNKPSIMILIYTGNLEDPYRIVLIGEIPIPVSSAPVSLASPTAVIGQRAVVLTDGARLRSSPSLNGPVINGLPFGTEIYIITLAQPVIADGVTWIFVQTPIGNGWIANDLITLVR
jgi:hypothetical protein